MGKGTSQNPLKLILLNNDDSTKIDKWSHRAGDLGNLLHKDIIILSIVMTRF